MDFTIQHILKLIDLLEAKGCDVGAICRACGLNVPELLNGHASLKAKQINHLWELAMEASQDETLGLQLGERYNFMALGLVGNIVQQSNTIEQALGHTIQFSNLLTNLLTIELEKQDKSFLLRFTPNPECLLQYPSATIQTIQTSMVFACKEYELLTFQKTKPLYASFAVPIKKHFNYQRIFKCAIQENALGFELGFDNQYLTKKIVGADYKLLALLVERANQILGEENFSLIKRNVRKILVQQFNNGFISIEDVAQLMHMSARTLQRKLYKEQTNFNLLLDEVKKDLALYYFHRNISITEISTILGYKNLSSFSRSFKKWTGLNPMAYQKMTND